MLSYSAVNDDAQLIIERAWKKHYFQIVRMTSRFKEGEWNYSISCLKHMARWSSQVIVLSSMHIDTFYRLLLEVDNIFILINNYTSIDITYRK